ncbi:TetR/AcrR family transcriptional regulator [Guptibacillus algicola]|uniref:TetR/AcrR family transcriptional regulator n=1 Tax=Guptibacillus algicola TaxID=225844 RepID=UPI001CD692A0|nr:TetR/AcrR family transcriptional regulator [Alkalihalobacillus algicola]MCA0987480.1 TetR/AcrR family transcriptional regulator [Alkalihalobacillus algicola]
MNDRKQQVIIKAHELFIDRGFQATSIQDILDYTNISKGTFYNYFSSKNELLIALFKSLLEEMETKRNSLMTGKDAANIDVFKKQIETQMNTNRKNRLLTLFEEVVLSPDEDIKEYIKESQARMLQWVYHRFEDLFSVDSKPYLLDCAIMFLGILHQNTKYYARTHGSTVNIQLVVNYTVNRIEKIVKEVTDSGEQLIEPDDLKNWLPDAELKDQSRKEQLNYAVLCMKKKLKGSADCSHYYELLEFIRDEFTQSNEPRYHLMKSALTTLQTTIPESVTEDLMKIEEIIGGQARA